MDVLFYLQLFTGKTHNDDGRVNCMANLRQSDHHPSATERKLSADNRNSAVTVAVMKANMQQLLDL